MTSTAIHVAAPAELLDGLLGAQHRDLRRRIGPVGVAVLVELVGDASLDVTGRLIVTTSARTLAGNMCVDKDTAAVALRRLTAAG